MSRKQNLMIMIRLERAVQQLDQIPLNRYNTEQLAEMLRELRRAK